MGRALGGFLHRRGDLFERGGGLFQAGGLLFGALRETVGGAAEISCVPVCGSRPPTDDRDDRRFQPLGRRVEIVLDPRNSGAKSSERRIVRSPPARAFNASPSRRTTSVCAEAARGALAGGALALGFHGVAAGERRAFQLQALDRVVLEDLHRPGHVADLVPAVVAADFDVEVAARQRLHLHGEPGKRRGDLRLRDPSGESARGDRETRATSASVISAVSTGWSVRPPPWRFR